jgi:hypothetical protein
VNGRVVLKTEPVAKAKPPEDRTVELRDYAAPRRVLPFADAKATVQLPRPAFAASAPPPQPQREARPWARWATGMAIALAVLLLDTLAAWLTVRSPP